ncbi:MAG: hypothetical protein ACI8R4_002656 [Paracoccaceae bacterium]|jgi:hypothetical protein
MLELRPNCEICDCDLPPDSDQARICTYECTYCASCAADVLRNVCPNCGGNLQPRPIRAVQSWRKGTGLAYHPASARRRHNRWSVEERAALSSKLKDVAPEDR